MAALYEFFIDLYKEGLFNNPFLILITVVLLIFLSYLARDLAHNLVRNLFRKNKSVKKSKNGIEDDTNAPEEKRIPTRKNREPSINKKTWPFTGAAYSLGKGSDGRTYFIGYFGNDLPPKYVKTTVDCETIVGANWDNTPQWRQHFEDVKNTYKLTAVDAPDYTGNGIQSNRELHGIYACKEELPNTDN